MRHILRAAAVCGSLAVLGLLITADIAAATEPVAAEVGDDAAPPPKDGDGDAPKKAKKKKPKKRLPSLPSFGRDEGY